VTSAPGPRLPVALLASGAGSNVAALLSAAPRGGWEPVLLISDREEAGALQVAREAGVPTRVVPPGPGHPEALARGLGEVGARLVLLAGYLRLVPAQVVERWQDRILNVHPSLLPSFGGSGMYGRRVHEAVLASGARVSGATVHLVNEHFDEGRILAQWPVAVRPEDDPASLAHRVLQAEHGLYPLAVAQVVAGLLRDPDSVPAPLDLLAPPITPLLSSFGLGFP
jgi:phosphoribosylglycinamide formyltransferase-1